MAADTELECSTCGRTERVSFAYCLGHGWPRCCGKTMRQVHTSADIGDAMGRIMQGAKRVLKGAGTRGR